VVTVSFKPVGVYGGIGDGWTLDTWRGVAQPAYPLIIWRTLWLSGLSTLLCILLGLPVALALARMQGKWRNLLLLLIILPFWTNFLIRIFAWRSLLHPEGFIKDVLVTLGLVDPAAQLLYNSGAILLVLVYTYLPFAILPLYAAAEKFDFTLLDAARDLGANRLTALWRIFLPGISTGLVVTFMIVFIPVLGSYAIPDIVGGPSSEMIGNKIAQRVFNDRNLPHASALSSILALFVLTPMVIIALLRRGGRRVSKEEAQA
jgi:spermidine/putrescine transport system permease protein